MDKRSGREPPFIDSPEQNMFERVSPPPAEQKSMAHSNAQVQDQDQEQERTHPDYDVIDTWHMGSDVPTVLERRRNGRSDATNSS